MIEEASASPIVPEERAAKETLPDRKTVIDTVNNISERFARHVSPFAERQNKGEKLSYFEAKQLADFNIFKAGRARLMGGDKPLDDSIEKDTFATDFAAYPELAWAGQKFETRKQLEAYWTHIDPLRERFSPYYKGAGETDQQGDWRQAEVALWNRRELKIPKKADTIVPPITPEPG